MVLDYEYGINTGNRFLNLVDHDEDPDDFVAAQTKLEEAPKKSSKDAKKVTTASTKKATTATASAASTATAGGGNATRTNKENFTGKPTNTDQRRQQPNVLGDNNNNQQGRFEGGRGGGRGFSRRGGSGGQDRPPYEGGGRGGGGQQRTQRFNKFEGGQQQQPGNEPSGFEQSGDAWGTDQGNENQPFSGYRGRGRGRGGPRRGYYEGDRGSGRGRGRGRGYYNNRNFEEGSQQQQQQPQESSQWQQSTESNFDNTRSQSARTGGQEGDADVSQQEQPFESDNVRRGGRGQFRSRTFRNNRNYGGDRPSHYEREGGEGSNEEYRQNRRLHDRQPRTNVSGVKPIEKKDGEGAHNWGSPTENPEENLPTEEGAEGAQAAAPAKDWSQQVDEAEKQMTLDEYKKQKVAQRQAHQEKVPQFNRRTAGEGVDLTQWNPYSRKYRKKNDDEESNGEEAEEGSDDEEHESEEEAEEEQTTGKKKLITIPLQFKPIEIPRGPAGSRGGPRRGAAGRYRDRPNRDDEENRPKSPSQQQQSSSFSQRTDDYPNDEQQSRPYRGASRQGSGRGEYRRSYGNSARGPRGGGYNRSNAGPNTLDLGNNVDFPTLPRQE